MLALRLPHDKKKEGGGGKKKEADFVTRQLDGEKIILIQHKRLTSPCMHGGKRSIVGPQPFCA